MVLRARGCHWLGRLQDTPRLSGSVALGRTGKASNQMKVDPIWEGIIFDRFLDERYAVLYIYIHVFVFCLCMLIWQCCGSCSCVQVDACVDAFLDGHAFAGRIHAKLGQSVQGFIFNPTWMSQELSKWLVNGL